MRRASARLQAWVAGDDGGERSDAWAASYHPTVGGAHGGGEGGGGGEDAGGGGGGGGGVWHISKGIYQSTDVTKA